MNTKTTSIMVTSGFLLMIMGAGAFLQNTFYDVNLYRIIFFLGVGTGLLGAVLDAAYYYGKEASKDD